MKNLRSVTIEIEMNESGDKVREQLFKKTFHIFQNVLKFKDLTFRKTKELPSVGCRYFFESRGLDCSLTVVSYKTSFYFELVYLGSLGKIGLYQKRVLQIFKEKSVEKTRVIFDKSY